MSYVCHTPGGLLTLTSGGYCSYIAPASFRDFAEVMYVLMCGTGVGFSVESQNIQALPQIQVQTGKKYFL